MKKNLLLALLVVVLAPATFQVEAAYANNQDNQEVRSCGCRRPSRCQKCRVAKPCPKKTCVVKERVCRKACPFKSKCETCEQRVARERAEANANRSEMNEMVDEEDMANSDLE